MTEPLSQIGLIRKAHGLKGELRIEVETKYHDTFLEATVLFLGSDKQQVPYFLEQRRSMPKPIIKLEEVDTREEAEQLQNMRIFVPTADLLTEEEGEFDAFQFGHLVGYTVIDPEKNILGHLERIEAYPHQEMGILVKDAKEFLIPMVDNFIVESDDEKREVVIDLPEGLLG